MARWRAFDRLTSVPKQRFSDEVILFADADGAFKAVDEDGVVSALAGAGSLPNPTDEGDVLTVVDGSWGGAPSGGSQPVTQSPVLKSTDGVFSVGMFAVNGIGGGDVAADLDRLDEAGAAGFGLPAPIGAISSPFYAQPNEDWMQPFFISGPLTIDAIGCILGGGEAAKHIRVALYLADEFGQPTTLVAQSGELDASSSGLVFTVLDSPVDLTGGMYVAMANSDATADTVYPHQLCVQGYMWSFDGANGCVSKVAVARAYGAFPSTYSGGWEAADVQNVAGDSSGGFEGGHVPLVLRAS